MEFPVLDAAHKLAEKLKEDGFLLFETPASQDLAMSLIRRAFVEGAAWVVGGKPVPS